MEEVAVESQMVHEVVLTWSGLSNRLSPPAPFQRSTGDSLIKQWIRNYISKKECCLFIRDSESDR